MLSHFNAYMGTIITAVDSSISAAIISAFVGAVVPADDSPE